MAYVASDSSPGIVTPIYSTGTAGTPITVGSDPTGVAITPNGPAAYAANYGDGTVTPIDTATNTAGPPITVGSNAAEAPAPTRFPTMLASVQRGCHRP